MYELKHLFADTIISPVIDGNQLQVYVISDLPVTSKLRATVKLINFDGNELFSREIDFQTNGRGSEMIFSIPIEKFNIVHLKKQVVLIAEVFNENKRLDRNLMYFVRPADLLLKPVTPKTEINESGNKSMILLQSSVLVKNVFLETNTEGFFSDNYFDLLPGEPKALIFQSESPVSSENSFTIKSLNMLDKTLPVL
jgi:beta-mannosidase